MSMESAGSLVSMESAGSLVSMESAGPLVSMESAGQPMSVRVRIHELFMNRHEISHVVSILSNVPYSRRGCLLDDDVGSRYSPC
jgi:hypothetical protein